MVRIRLRRMGAKKKPFYRIVVANQQSPRNGRFIESIGTYNPLTDPETVRLRHERATYWLSVGAQPSDPVARLLRSANLLDENGKAIPYDAEAVAEAAEEATAEKTDGSAEKSEESADNDDEPEADADSADDKDSSEDAASEDDAEESTDGDDGSDSEEE